MDSKSYNQALQTLGYFGKILDSLLEIYSKMLGFFACHFLRISTRVKISQNKDTKELKKDKLSAGNYIRVGVLLSSLCEIFSQVKPSQFESLVTISYNI